MTRTALGSLLVLGALMTTGWGVADASVVQSKRAQSPLRLHLTAITPDSKDLDPNAPAKGAVSDLPAGVEARVRELAARQFRRYLALGDKAGSGVRPEQFYGPIIRIKAPSGRDLYVFDSKCSPEGAGYYFFILYDPGSGCVTRKAPLIYDKWMEGDWGEPLEKPLISFMDLDGDGRQELVVRERVHNGTMYNGVMCHYYRIAADCSLPQIVAIETTASGAFAGGGEGYIVRSVSPVSRDELKLTAILKFYEVKRTAEVLGQVTLRRTRADAPFQVAARQIVKKKYRDQLVSSSFEERDNEILRHGYRGYY